MRPSLSSPTVVRRESARMTNRVDAIVAEAVEAVVSMNPE
jgi:hypothetical protein